MTKSLMHGVSFNPLEKAMKLKITSMKKLLKLKSQMIMRGKLQTDSIEKKERNNRTKRNKVLIHEFPT